LVTSLPINCLFRDFVDERRLVSPKFDHAGNEQLRSDEEDKADEEGEQCGEL